MALDLDTSEYDTIEKQVIDASVEYNTGELGGGNNAGLPFVTANIEDVAGGLRRDEVATLLYAQGTFSAVLQGTTETIDTSVLLETHLTVSPESPVEGGGENVTHQSGAETNVAAETTADHIMTMQAAAGGGFEDSASGVGGGSSQNTVESDFDFTIADGIAMELDRHDHLYAHFEGVNFDAQDAIAVGKAKFQLVYGVEEE